MSSACTVSFVYPIYPGLLYKVRKRLLGILRSRHKPLAPAA
ncbi:hypothetical protein CGRA01v4_14480 [Colletotrichum graminicola]|nr:hypothetical protein CGRA01v4_14480 [Colletotrichum graminicola]